MTSLNETRYRLKYTCGSLLAGSPPYSAPVRYLVIDGRISLAALPELAVLKDTQPPTQPAMIYYCR